MDENDTPITEATKDPTLRHPACDSSFNNYYADVILSRHIQNLIMTYGEDHVFKVLEDVHGLVKQDKKAS